MEVQLLCLRNMNKSMSMYLPANSCLIYQNLKNFAFLKFSWSCMIIVDLKRLSSLLFFSLPFLFLLHSNCYPDRSLHTLTSHGRKKTAADRITLFVCLLFRVISSSVPWFGKMHMFLSAWIQPVSPDLAWSWMISWLQAKMMDVYYPSLLICIWRRCRWLCAWSTSFVFLCSWSENQWNWILWYLSPRGPFSLEQEAHSTWSQTASFLLH